MLYECTDCYSCANFADGYRVFCLHKNLPSNAVIDYYPVGDGNAKFCIYFKEGVAFEFSYEDLKKIKESKGELTYETAKEWCLEHL